jgi:hypothetical protein
MAYGIYDSTQAKVIAEFVTPLTVRSNQPVTVSDTLSLKRNTFRRATQRWEVEAKLFPLSNSAQDLMVNLITKGVSETMQIIMPQNYGAKQAKTATSTVTIYATVAASSSQLLISANASNNAKVIPKGTFIKFSNHTKIYMITSDAVLSGTLNTVALNIYPVLRSAVPAGTTITYQDDVIMNCKYDTDTVIGMVYEDGILMDNGTVKLVEAI